MEKEMIPYRGIKSIVHNGIRIVILLMSGSCLPLAFLYLLQNQPELIQSFPVIIVFILVLGGIFWAIFYILFQQRYFPPGLQGALIHIVALAGNAVVAAHLGIFNVLYGAYSVVVASLASQAVYFTLMLLFFVNPKSREKYFYYSSRSSLILLFTGASGLWAMLVLFYSPVIDEFVSESHLLWRIVYCISVVFHIIRDARNYLRNNMFQYDSDGKREERDAVLKKWGIPVALTLVLSIVSCLIIIGIYQVINE